MKLIITEGQYDQLMENSLPDGDTISQFLQQNNILEKPTFFKKGTSKGNVYKLGDKILKVTSDPVEYTNAVKLSQRPTKGFIRYYKAQPVGDKYVLVMDLITDLTDQQWDVVDYIENNLGTSTYMLDDRRRSQFYRETRQNPEYYEHIDTDFETIEKYTEAIKQMYILGKRNGLQLHDLRAQNLGIDKNGQLVHFDLGSG